MGPVSSRHKLIAAVIVAASLISTQSWRALAGAGQDLEPQAVDGALDPSFGNGGNVLTDFFGDDDQALGVAIQQDGKIVAAGYCTTSGASPHPDFALTRYNTDGSLDQNFGSNGRVTTDFFSVYNTLYGVAIQPDGKILAVGDASHPGEETDFAVARYNTDGSLDAGFGTGGKATTNFFGFGDAAFAVALGPDGKIIMAGHARPQAGNGTPIFALARFNPDGTLDTSFGTGGKVSNTIGNISEAADAVVVQPDNKIVIAGYTVLKQGGPVAFAVLRYMSDGRLDPTFGSGGAVTTAISGGDCVAYGVKLQSDGKIVAAGYAQKSSDIESSDFALVRYNADGSLDSSFGGGGLVASSGSNPQTALPGAITTDFFGFADAANALVIQSDGRILAAGYSQTTSAFDSGRFAIARYMPNGELDPAFGANGKTVSGISGHSSFANAIGVQSDGRIVLAGSANSTTNSKGNDFAVARYTVQSDFSLGFDQPNLNAMAGTRASVQVLVNRTGGFSGNVTITAPDASSIKVKIKPPDPVTTTSTSVKYSLKIKAAAPAGPHQLAFTAVDDAGRTRNATLTLNIE